MDFEEVKAIKAKITPGLLKKYPQINGIGITKKGEEWALKINLLTRPKESMPEVFEGVSAVYDVIGEVNAR